MVMVPVPEYLVTDVYRFIVREEERRASSPNETQDVSGPQGTEEAWRYGHDWSEDDLRDVLENGTLAMRKVLPYLAEHAGERVEGQVLAELVYGDGARMQQLGGALGSFTKTARKEYGRQQWPFKAIPPSGERRTWQYVMYEDTAEKVRKLARGKSGTM